MFSALKKNKAEKEVRVMEVGAASLMKLQVFLFLRDFFCFLKKMSKGVSICAT